MGMRGGPRLQVGSAAWIAEERDSALNIARSEIEEFSFSARNEMDWLNEHMAEIFSDNQMNVAELFKTPGKLRGKTPRTTRKAEPGGVRVPLSHIFSATPKAAPNPFALSNLAQLRSPKLRIPEDKPAPPVSQPDSPTKAPVVHPPYQVESRPPISLADSGYHGSQSQDTMPFDHFDKDVEMSDGPGSPPQDLPDSDPVFSPTSASGEQRRPSVTSVEEAIQPAIESQTWQDTAAEMTVNVAPTPSSSPKRSRTGSPLKGSSNQVEDLEDNGDGRNAPTPAASPPKTSKLGSPQKGSSNPTVGLETSDMRSARTPWSSSPKTTRAGSPQKGFPNPTEDLKLAGDERSNEHYDPEAEEVRSPSDASSPIRPIVRKSSLNFASLPAREPLTSKKSIGGTRVSRTSHLDYNRQSYYNRHTGGKSLGGIVRQEASDDDQDEMDTDNEIAARDENADARVSADSKTYTQRLQDQISMLGKAQSTGSRPSKSLANFLPSQQGAPASQTQPPQVEPALENKKQSPQPNPSVRAPGAFPEDDADDWITPPGNTAEAARQETLPSATARSDVREGSSGKEAVTASLLQSPSANRPGYRPEASIESFKTADSVVYPDLSQQLAPTSSNNTRRTRASAERERQEAQQREEKEERGKEAKEREEQAKRVKEKEERERASKEQEKHAKEREEAKERAKAVKSRDEEVMDQEMTDATTTAPPQSIPRPTTASSMRTQSIKRPLKPTKETITKSKQAPTLIRVNTTSSQQTQFHPSNSVLSTMLQETLGQQPGSVRQPNGKASQASLHGKPSLHSLKSSVSSSTGRPKALELAAKRKEQEEREAQRKRETKLEMERKRAAQEEERRQEQQRRLEAERQREEERKAALAKKAAIEKAKQTKAPPPAVRSQPNGPPEYSLADKAPMRPPSRLGSTMHQDGRLVNTVLSSTAKGPMKRPLQQDAGEESSRNQPARALPSLPAKEGKRLRMSEEFDEELHMVESHSQRTIKGPPVRPSGGLKKDLPSKPTYASGYPNAHPLGLAQFSKGAIPFAPNPNHAGPAHHKTPARPAGGAVPKSAKSVARSPRFQNGETIELPDIQTDDDSDDDDGHVAVAAWADSPALKAALLAQERVDPMQVFGPPAPLNMEEVFSKTKDRWHKFRARTSSANWSGTDRLTEDDIRKDMAARDKMRREGGWSYELSRDMS
ncbi:uncharacterized protein B0T15DRAFT_414955 [Chaetomium strumarium]|uniref:Inner centromere protein ARK-binding domain-containing protein n=1 Tax=Chaetomium strumarium TaxID=1170767 RepID=A0AAJ0M3E7_9PEZI|nr:hypothetical protein B0T15DRAFT_414955 [Chaetomium strumarium]